MNRLVDILFFLAFVFGSGYGLQKAVIYVRNAVLVEVHKGLPPMQPFTEKMTGKKSLFR